MTTETNNNNLTVFDKLAGPKMEAEVTKLFDRHNRVAEGFGQLMLLLLQAPRYGKLTVSELAGSVLEPLASGNILLSRPTQTYAGVQSVTVGAAIWGKVSSNVDDQIRDQIERKVFPVQLATSDWNSGEIYWVFDIVAPDVKLLQMTFENIKNHLKTPKLFVHPALGKILQMRKVTN